MKPTSTLVCDREASRNRRSCNGPVSKVVHSTATPVSAVQGAVTSPLWPVATVLWTRWEKTCRGGPLAAWPKAMFGAASAAPAAVSSVLLSISAILVSLPPGRVLVRASLVIQGLARLPGRRVRPEDLADGGIGGREVA